MRGRMPRVIAVLALVLAACALHHPVNVDPSYPPPTPMGAPRDAGTG